LGFETLLTTLLIDEGKGRRGRRGTGKEEKKDTIGYLHILL